MLSVFVDKFGKSFPKYQAAAARRCQHTRLEDVLARRFTSDAHFTCYTAEPALRLSLDALADVAVTMTALVIDVDDREGKSGARPEWWAEERARLSLLRCASPGLVAYTTRGGYRIVGRLSSPLRLVSREHWRSFYSTTVEYLRKSYDIHADDLGDWTRMFRAPYVRRDGRATEPEWVGGPERVGAWGVGPRPEDVELSARRISTPQTRQPLATNGVLYDLFRARGWELGPGRWKCPWSDSHSNGDPACALFAPAGKNIWGAYSCFHHHCAHRTWRDVLALFSQSEIEAAKIGDVVLLAELSKTRPAIQRKEVA